MNGVVPAEDTGAEDESEVGGPHFVDGFLVGHSGQVEHEPVEEGPVGLREEVDHDRQTADPLRRVLHF